MPHIMQNDTSLLSGCCCRTSYHTDAQFIPVCDDCAAAADNLDEVTSMTLSRSRRLNQTQRFDRQGQRQIHFFLAGLRAIHRLRKNKPSPLICGRLRPENLLLIMTLIAVILGSGMGVYLNPTFKYRDTILTERQLSYVKFPGDMFLSLLKMLIIPLVMSSNISSVSSLAPRAARWLAGLTIIYFIATSFIAVLIGTVLVLLIKPGEANSVVGGNDDPKDKNGMRLFDSLLNLIRNLFPDNIVAATFTQKHLTWETVSVLNISTNVSQHFDERIEADPQTTNILGLIVFSIMFGIAVRNLGTDAAILAEMFHALRRAVIYLVSIAMWFSPIGIMSLIAEQIAKEQDLDKSIKSLTMYVATVMTGLFIHGVIILPLLLILFARRNPLKFAYKMLQALMCAMGTASSTATLPCTIRCLEKGNNIDNRVTRFMLPLGTTINMDGTVMYEAIAVIYIAQRLGYQLTVGEILLVVLTSVLAGMAATSMPSAGLITMTMVLMAVGLPGDKFKMILPIDWFLDRFRTTVNVFGDAVGAAIVSKLCEERLKEEPQPHESELPDPEDAVTVCPGGLKNVDLSELNDYDDYLLCQPSSRKSNISSRADLNAFAAAHLTPVVEAASRKRRANNRHSVATSGLTEEEQHTSDVEAAVPRRPVNGSLTPLMQPKGDATTCLYMVDEDTVLLKF